MSKLLSVLKNKKFWASVAVIASLVGGYTNPQAIVAVGEVIGIVVDASEAQ